MSTANNDMTPYDIPKGPAALIQYYIELKTDVVQLHLQDQWHIRPDLLVQAGVKSSLQTASNTVPINQKNLPTVAVPVVFPTGSITSNEWFLPQFGAVWDPTSHEQIFVNAQQNMRQFIPYGAGSGFYGVSPWSLGSQAAFDAFKSTVKPEKSWTYEVGARTHRALDLGPLTSFDGQASLYHVDFSNRLLNIAAFNFINPGAAVIVNVGGVTTNGVDLAGTFNFGSHIHFYDAISFSDTTYDSSYQTASKVNGVLTNVTVPIAGKRVPLTPDWMNKFILSAEYGPFEAQLSGDYVGKRYAEYLNQFQVASTFQLGLQASYKFDVSHTNLLKSAKLSVNVTNLNDEKGVSTISPGSVSITSTGGFTTGYSTFPLAPRQVFVTLQAAF
jgi:outer membrane receptor protein involved in Fe transport